MRFPVGVDCQHTATPKQWSAHHDGRRQRLSIPQEQGLDLLFFLHEVVAKALSQNVVCTVSGHILIMTWNSAARPPNDSTSKKCTLPVPSKKGLASASGAFFIRFSVQNAYISTDRIDSQLHTAAVAVSSQKLRRPVLHDRLGQ